MNYITIIGNIIHSKQVSQRSNTIEVLKQQLNRINQSRKYP